MAIDGAMTIGRLATAKRHVYNVCQTGHSVTLKSGSSKDEMGSPLSDSDLNFKAFPVRYSPYDREVLQKISWAENTDILIYISKEELDNNSLKIANLQRKYKKIRHANKDYEIRYIEPYSAFFNDFLYVVIGGKS
jgi:hypothetical protein